jgi:hypothetical protein
MTCEGSGFQEDNMAFTKKLDVSYHQQDHKTYCAAACAQMVLDTLCRQFLHDNPRPLIPQYDLPVPHYDLQVPRYDLQVSNYDHGKAAGWQVDPQGLAYTLNHGDPALGRTKSYDTFRVYTSASEDAISRMIVWSIYKYDAPAVALVFGNRHWVVVSGFTTSKEPDPDHWNDRSYEIIELILNDPRPRLMLQDPLKPLPPPHNDGDGCGSGGSRGSKDHRIPHKTWWIDYFHEPVPDGGDLRYNERLKWDYDGASKEWLSKFVAVCAGKYGVEPENGEIEPAPGQPLVRSYKLPATREEEETIQKVAPIRLRESGPAEAIWYKELFDDGEPVKSWDPVLVEYRHPLGSGKECVHDNYIIPIEKPGKGVLAAVRVDASNGEYRESLGVYDDPFGLAKPVDKRNGPGSMAVGLLSGPATVISSKQLEPKLVWIPSIHSFTPSFPRYEYDVRGQEDIPPQGPQARPTIAGNIEDLEGARGASS